MSLTIDQIKEKKDLLKSKIIQLINNFENETYTNIEEIKLDIEAFTRKKVIILKIDSGI